MNRYLFKDISTCEMCGSPSKNHKVLGQRLNKHQGFRPKGKTGVSVSIVKCSNCGLIYSNPQPIPFDLQDHYGIPPEQYWKEEYFLWNPNYLSYQIDRVKRMINFEKGMKSLDIGAGLGKGMLSMAHKGFDAYGIEPSMPFYERATTRMNIDTEKLKFGTIEDADFEHNYFDFISFGAVLEHLYEPAKCLKKALDWLKPNGIIYVEVPSSRWLLPKLVNFYFKLIGTNYVTNLSPMHSPFHLHEFELKTFTELSKTLPFKVDFYRYYVSEIYFIPKILQMPIRKYMQATNQGMMLVLYLRKI
jgi:SAM-dependent methyltransferase